MKIVVPYVRLNSKTATAVLEEFQPGDEIIWGDTSASDSAYFQLLLEHWRKGDTFVNLEQDKIPAPGALREIYECDHPWCTYPHLAHQGDWVAEQPTLGCTKFRADVMAGYPNLIEMAGRLDIGLGAYHWQRLDMLITAGLMWAVGNCHVHEFGQLEHEHVY